MGKHERIELAAGEKLNNGTEPFPVTVGDDFTFSVPMQVPYGSKGCGLVFLIFLDGNRKDIAQMNIFLKPGVA